MLIRRKSHMRKGKKREEVLVLTLSHPSLLSPWHTHPLTVQNLQHCHFKVSFSNSALVSAGIKLVFFPVATMVLCSGFKVWIMLITHQCCSCCWTVLTSSPVLFGFLYCQKRAGGAKRARTADPEWPKGYPTQYGIVLSKRRETHVKWYYLSFQ